MSFSFTEISPGGQLGWARRSLRSRIIWRRGGYFGTGIAPFRAAHALDQSGDRFPPAEFGGGQRHAPHGLECAFRQGGSNILTVAQVTENAIL
jgi:hypothetical protein